MQEYRTTLELDPETQYTYVEMGPKPDVPLWHHLASPSRYPFPKESAAFRFAEAHKEPGRKIHVLTTDGERIEI
ncbi:hypothetical protein PBI_KEZIACHARLES14_71 [Mycobacterium phage Keziacharles14]|nr:hypothetical protein PBI_KEZIACHARLES14_71 [Mycobacterium phage Keziacharles14]